MISDTLLLIRERIRRSLTRRRSRLTSARYDTSDIIQETWIQVWKHLVSRGGEGEVEDTPDTLSDAQIACYSKGHAAKMYRKHTAEKRNVAKDASSSLDESRIEKNPKDEFEKLEQLEVLCLAIDGLHPISQAFVFYHFFEQLSLSKIGQELKMTVDQVRGLKKRTFRDLRVRMNGGALNSNS